MKRSEIQCETAPDSQRKKIDALRGECCNLRQEISLLEVKEKKLVEHNAETSSRIACLEAEAISKERELNSFLAVCGMQKDKINRLMQHTQMALMRKAEAELAYKEEAAKMSAKRKQADELLGRIREEVLSVTALMDNAPWVKARQELASRIEELKQQLAETDGAFQVLKMELTNKLEIVEGHKKLPFQYFCKSAATLSLKLRGLLSKLAGELVTADKLRKTQKLLESQGSLDESIQAVGVSDAPSGQENTGPLSVEDHLENSGRSVSPQQCEELRRERSVKEVSSVEENKATQGPLPLITPTPQKCDELLLNDNNSLLTMLEDSESLEFAKTGQRDVSMHESITSALNASSLEPAFFHPSDEISFNQSTDIEMNDILGDIEKTSAEILKTPFSSKRQYGEGKRFFSKNSKVSEGFEQIDSSPVSQLFQNADDDNSEFNVSSLNPNASNDFNPTALLDLSAAVKETDSNMDFMSMFADSENRINLEGEKMFSFDFDVSNSTEKNNNRKGPNKPFLLF